MLEMIQLLSSNKYNNTNRTFRNMYKTADRAKDFGMIHSEEDKQRQKRAYSMLKKHNENTTIDSKAKEYLFAVLNRAFNGECPKLSKQFIFDYHISFIRDYNPTMKQRFYDKYFPETESYPLEQMDEFFEAIKTVTRTFTKLKNEVEKTYRSYGRNAPEDVTEMVREFNNIITNLWSNDDLAPAFKDYNSKLLKKLGK